MLCVCVFFFLLKLLQVGKLKEKWMVTTLHRQRLIEDKEIKKWSMSKNKNLEKTIFVIPEELILYSLQTEQVDTV